MDHFSAPLCEFMLTDMVEDIIDQGSTRASSYKETLEYLEHANLYLIPLDDQMEWYRYHSLFSDLLRYRLRLSQEISAQSLHLKAR